MRLKKTQDNRKLEEEDGEEEEDDEEEERECGEEVEEDDGEEEGEEEGDDQGKEQDEEGEDQNTTSPFEEMMMSQLIVIPTAAIKLKDQLRVPYTKSVNSSLFCYMLKPQNRSLQSQKMLILIKK